MMDWFYGGMGWGGWLIMTLTMVAFWTMVVWAVVAITRSDRPGDLGKADPMRILDQRLARGDIDEAEYHRLHDVLEAGVR